MTALIQASFPQLTQKKILNTWWPLALSWLLMGLELPAISAVIARLEDPEIHLAAYGGVVFPLALIIEAPIIMLLAASTALSKDWASYTLLRNYMRFASILLTSLHIVIAFTPLYYVVVEDLIGVPAEIIEPARIGLMIMTPWTWSIAYRRFNQGVLIRFGHPKSVSIGTAIRLGMDVSVLIIGYTIGTLPGIVVATSAIILSVVAEALFVAIRIRPVIRLQVKSAPPVEPSLTYRAFAIFYIPLAFTSLLTLIVQPIGSAALSRMPLALESLAAWTVVSGLSFMLRSLGIAFNEVVVALLDEPLSTGSLWRFAKILAVGTTLFLIAMILTPLADIYFNRFSALPPDLAKMARFGLWFVLPTPALATLQSWYQGCILNSRRTRAIPEAVLVFLVIVIIVLGVGITLNTITGLFVGLIAYTSAMFTQTIWLWFRSRSALTASYQRDEAILRQSQLAFD
ncbi:hypothetical protein ACFLXI_05695 [Chloroflexota bacterium]